jgi:cell fate regulator YaaT (PSP1 superfamily)
LEENNNIDFLSRGCKACPQPHSRQLNVFEHSCNKLDALDWLKKIRSPDGFPYNDIVEVRFKNSRKEFFRTTPDLELAEGDIVAVEASPGHDIGIVSMVGEIVKLQMKNKKVNSRNVELRKVYRKAKVTDVEKWVSAVKLEDQTMFRSRGMAGSLKLDMKISDVEYQGDRTKAIFYYTADERVDFRELIKVLAEAFNVRIEMRQIGMRQEASRLGGIGSCGRELCCATWLTNFRSVSTNAARTQQLSLNPQKLAGQCSKLKCCINFETDCYLDALKEFPDTNIELLTKKGKAVFQKLDVLRRSMTYAYVELGGNCVSISLDRAKEIIQMNRRKQFPEDLLPDADSAGFDGLNDFSTAENGSSLEDSITRFDNPKASKKKKRKKKPKKNLSANSTTSSQKEE